MQNPTVLNVSILSHAIFALQSVYHAACQYTKVITLSSPLGYQLRSLAIKPPHITVVQNGCLNEFLSTDGVISPLLIYCVFQKASNVAHLSKPQWRAQGEHIPSQSSIGATETQTFQCERDDLEEKTFGGAINCSHLASIAFFLFSLFIVVLLVPGTLRDTERERRTDTDR